MQHGVGSMAAGGIFVQQKPVRIDGGLVVGASETLAHFCVKFRDSLQGIRNFGSARGDQVNAAIAGNYLAIIGEGAFCARLDIQRDALLFGALELRPGLFLNASSWRSGRGGGYAGKRGKETQQEEKRRNAGEGPTQIICGIRRRAGLFQVWYRSRNDY